MSTETLFAPIFEKDGNEFVCGVRSWLGQTEDETWRIGWGVAFVEGILLRFKFTGKVMPAIGKQVHYEGKLAGMKIAILSGPLFDGAKKKEEQGE